MEMSNKKDKPIDSGNLHLKFSFKSWGSFMHELFKLYCIPVTICYMYTNHNSLNSKPSPYSEPYDRRMIGSGSGSLVTPWLSLSSEAPARLNVVLLQADSAVLGSTVGSSQTSETVCRRQRKKHNTGSGFHIHLYLFINLTSSDIPDISSISLSALYGGEISP